MEIKINKEIKELQSRGVHVIASHHDFAQTPDRSVMRMLLEQIYRACQIAEGTRYHK